MIKKYLFFAVFVSFSGHAASIGVTVAKPLYQPGQTVIVDLSASNVTDLYSFQVDLAFNPAILSAQSVTEEGYFATNGVSFGPVTIDNTTGTISYIADTLSGPGPGFTGTTLLAAIDFTAIAGGAGSVTPENVILLNSNLDQISATLSGAVVNVAPEPAYAGLLGALLVTGITVVRRRSR